MARKRTGTEVNAEIQPLCHDAQKRARLSPSATRKSYSSESSNCSISEASALRSTPSLSEQIDRPSSLSSVPVSDESSSAEEIDETESSPSGSSDEQLQGDEESIVTLGGPQKPNMNCSNLNNSMSLKARLAAFLPQIEKANAQLCAQESGFEVVEEGEQYIEMDLGLGVLEDRSSEGVKGGDGEQCLDTAAATQSVSPSTGLDAREYAMDELQGRCPGSKEKTNCITEVG